jgi:hypothetical protein
MSGSRTQPLTSARVRYGLSSGTMRSGASASSFCVPSSSDDDTNTPLKPALRRICTACFTGTDSTASWL